MKSCALLFALCISTAAALMAARSVHAELQAQGERCGRKRVARLMRAEGLRVKVRRRFRPTTTDSRHPHPVAANVLARRFSVAEITAPNRVWAGDITYVPTREGWLYLAVILDLASRRVVGWSMQATLEASLALAALQMALEARCPGSGLVHHSDRGVRVARPLIINSCWLGVRSCRA